MITITLNGKSVSIESNLSILTLLMSHTVEVKNINSIAVVINDHILPRSQWTDVNCQENDQIEVFKAVAGG